jgi:hypothetical protein
MARVRAQVQQIGVDLRREFLSYAAIDGVDPDDLDALVAEHDRQFEEWLDGALAQLRIDTEGASREEW